MMCEVYSDGRGYVSDGSLSDKDKIIPALYHTSWLQKRGVYIIQSTECLYWTVYTPLGGYVTVFGAGLLGEERHRASDEVIECFASE